MTDDLLARIKAAQAAAAEVARERKDEHKKALPDYGRGRTGKRAPDVEPLPGEFKHGQNGYGNIGCRCRICRDANTKTNLEARKARHARMLAGEVNPTHGKSSTYLNYGCRCRLCTDVNTQRSYAARARNVEREEMQPAADN